MPEKKYPPRFDFKKLEPDVAVEFTLLKKSFSGKATKDGEEYEWHLWPVKHTGIEMSLFTPNERVHAGLLYLKIKVGDKFTLIKRASVNTETGKPFIYYDMICDGLTVDTKDTLPAEPTEEVEPEDPLADTPVIKEPKSKQRVSSYEDTLRKTIGAGVDIFQAYCGEVWEQADMAEKATYLLDIMRILAPSVSTQLINQEKKGG